MDVADSAVLPPGLHKNAGAIPSRARAFVDDPVLMFRGCIDRNDDVTNVGH